MATYVRVGDFVVDEATVDSMCSYYTQKRVRIRDQRLGVVFFACVLACLIYLVVEIIAYNGYMEFAEILGSVRVDVVSDPRRLGPSTAYAYCNSSLPESPRCMFMDPHDLVYPAHEESAVLITTRMAGLVQERTVPVGAAATGQGLDGPLWRTVSDGEDNYALGVEDFNVTFHHSIYLPAELSYLKGDDEHMDGVFVDQAGQTIMKLPGKQLPTIPLGTLLDAAGVSLDEPPAHPVPSAEVDAASVDFLRRSASRKPTRRDLGLVVVVVMSYSNTYTALWRAKQPRYTLSVYHLKNHRFAIDEVTSHGPTSRYLKHRAGVRIVVYQKGQVGYYSFRNLLLNIASGLVIINAANFIVDSLARYVLPDRDRYYRYMFEETDLGTFIRRRERVVKENFVSSILTDRNVRRLSPEAYQRLEDLDRQSRARRGLSGLVRLLCELILCRSDSARRQREDEERERILVLWAATIIQSAYRGHMARRSLRRRGWRRGRGFGCRPGPRLHRGGQSPAPQSTGQAQGRVQVSTLRGNGPQGFGAGRAPSNDGNPYRQQSSRQSSAAVPLIVHLPSSRTR